MNIIERGLHPSYLRLWRAFCLHHVVGKVHVVPQLHTALDHCSTGSAAARAADISQSTDELPENIAPCSYAA